MYYQALLRRKICTKIYNNNWSRLWC